MKIKTRSHVGNSGFSESQAGGEGSAISVIETEHVNGGGQMEKHAIGIVVCPIEGIKIVVDGEQVFHPTISRSPDAVSSDDNYEDDEANDAEEGWLEDTNSGSK